MGDELGTIQFQFLANSLLILWHYLPAPGKRLRLKNHFDPNCSLFVHHRGRSHSPFPQANMSLGLACRCQIHDTNHTQAANLMLYFVRHLTTF